MAFGLVQRVLALPGHFRALLQRAGGLPLFAFVVAGFAILYTTSKRRRIVSYPQGESASRGTRASRSATASRKGKRLDGVRRVSVGLDAGIATILKADQEKNFTIDESTMVGLKKLVTQYDVYVIVRVEDDPTEDKVREAFKQSGLYQHGLNPLKVVFCETHVGRVSSVRQLEPHLHVDCDLAVVHELQRFVRQLLYLNPDGSGSSDFAPNIMDCISLEKLFEE